MDDITPDTSPNLHPGFMLGGVVMSNRLNPVREPYACVPAALDLSPHSPAVQELVRLVAPPALEIKT
ncbi:MAG: hypothetical protein Q8O79_05740 [Pseudomonadota bacterium]|nr:hypothetical protein [Pseudomonadota bacterium]